MSHKRKTPNESMDSTLSLESNNNTGSQPLSRKTQGTPSKIRRTDAQQSAHLEADENEEPTSGKTRDKADRQKRITSYGIPDLSQLQDIGGGSGVNCKSEDAKLLQGIFGKKAGSIQAISLKNFKCHNYLEFSLHQYINFIIGRNGSGKSAVMDAIILCMGGRTQNTGRQANARTFIKTNCDRADLSVTLCNEGDDAYKPDEYGKRIRIERRINKEGGGYKILNDETGKMVSIKKGELDNIVEQFNIQVDNPVCFLNQETSKNFLNTSNKSNKYQLFMKASQLEMMKKSLQEIEQIRIDSEQAVQTKKESIPKLEAEAYEAEQKFKQCQSHDDMRKKMSVLLCECSWSFVIQKEVIVDDYEKQKARIVKEKEKTVSKLEEARDRLAENNTDYEEKKAQLDELYKTMKKTEPVRNKVEAELKQASLKYKQKNAEKIKHEKLLEKKKKDKQEIAEKLAEEKKNSKMNFDHEKQEKEDKLNELRQKLKDAKSLESTKQMDIRNFAGTIEQQETLIDEKRTDIKNTQSFVTKCNSDIERLRGAAKNQLSRFGEFMPGLVEDMNQAFKAGKFKKLPKGPIGSFLQPKQHSHSLAIEQSIGRNLLSFICANYDDERVMHQLIATRVGNPKARPNVIVADFTAKLFDAEKFRPEHRQYPTVYEMLTISDSVVANVLMDMTRIECILILPNLEVGKEIIERRSTANCNTAYLLNGDRLLGGAAFRVYSCTTNSAAYFCENRDSIIESKKKDIEKCNEQIERKKVEMKGHQDEIASIRAKKQQVEKQLESIRREQLSLGTKLKETENIRIPEPADMLFFEEEIVKHEQEIEQIQPMLDDVYKELITLKEEENKAVSAQKEYEKDNEAILKEIEKFKPEIDDTAQKVSQCENSVNHYQKILNQKEIDEKNITNKLDQLLRERENLVIAATQLGARIQTRKKTETIQSEIQTIEENIRRAERLYGNEQEITRNYHEKREKMQKIRQDMIKEEKLVKRIRKMEMARNDKMETYIQSKSVRCDMEFSSLLTSRNYVGKMTFDHVNKTLDIMVHPNKSKDAKEAKDLKSLSGGERSFSTVAFLLSLWSIVECPILFLDEFDVFMDQINRSFAMELIVSHAKQKAYGQYVFLTPQEMGAIKPDDKVKIFKMPDPKRAIDQHNNENQEN